MAPDASIDDALDRVREALAIVEPVADDLLPDLLMHATTPEQAALYGDASVNVSAAWAGLRIAQTALEGIIKP